MSDINYQAIVEYVKQIADASGSDLLCQENYGDICDMLKARACKDIPAGLANYLFHETDFVTDVASNCLFEAMDVAGLDPMDDDLFATHVASLQACMPHVKLTF